MTPTEFMEAPEHLPHLQELLENWRAAAPEPKMELCQRVWRGECERPVWLLGRNEASKKLLAQGLRCNGVIDDFSPEADWRGLPIQQFDQIETDAAVVINCVQNSQATEASHRIEAAKDLSGLSFSDFYRADLLPASDLPLFSARTCAALREKPDIFDPLWNDLTDPLSRRTFADIISFRLTTDPWFLRNYRYRPEEQYFEDFLNLPREPVFIDAGAYHGETSLEFARRYPHYSTIHAFEPSTTNADELVKQTSALQRLQLHRVGLSDQAGVVRFASQLGSASRTSETGDMQIPMIRLDDLELKQADLIKMDLEGGERRALLGGAATIQRSKSRLAIGAYHDPEDFATLHRVIRDLINSPKFYIRHYTSGWAETVLYAIPEQKHQ